MNRRTPLTPLAVSVLFAPFGLLLMAYGVSIGVEGQLSGRNGAILKLDRGMGWMVGGMFLALGAAVAGSPLWYWLRSERPPDQT